MLLQSSSKDGVSHAMENVGPWLAGRGPGVGEKSDSDEASLGHPRGALRHSACTGRRHWTLDTEGRGAGLPRWATLPHWGWEEVIMHPDSTGQA